jgi:ABC-type transporter lipoprotein component MlaA/pimeloyl-ACP methyl ester carboxylesterase
MPHFSSRAVYSLSRLNTRVLHGPLLVGTTLVVSFCLVSSTLAQSIPAPSSESVVLPEPVPDPFEPFNRGIWAFNKGIILRVVKPTARAYRAVVIKPVRTSISNVGRNATYPGRLINNLLQAKWAGAGHETERFLCNTTIGVAGIFDVATKWNIPKSDADFGQTFGHWGWRPRCYLMLPIFGPSNERDALGFAADTAANPLTYLTPYPFTPTDPLTYFSPYTYHSAVVVYNNLADSVDDYARFSEAEMDPYSFLHYAWTFVRDVRKPDFTLKGDLDEASLQTLQSVTFTVKDEEFPNRSKTRSVKIPSTGKGLKFTYWLQPGKAPVVYIIPGIGSHRLAGTALALAELVYGQGFSVVCLSNPYNYEFMEHASTAAMPAYTPVDVRDLQVALTQIDRRLQSRHPNRLGAKALLGYSMGGFHTLYLSATGDAGIKFDRYIAIDTPVRLLYAISKLDAFYDAPLAWPAETRTAAIENTFLKLAALRDRALAPDAPPPFEAIESKFLIGLTFRLILRDVIFSSQVRTNQGILKHYLDPLRRGPVYREILQFSFKDYFDKFATPYYQARGVDLADPEMLGRASDLRTYTLGLKADPNLRIIVNRNDIILDATDLNWLETTFESKRLTVFDKGGHLGNLHLPETQNAIVRALDGLRSVE